MKNHELKSIIRVGKISIIVFERGDKKRYNARFYLNGRVWNVYADTESEAKSRARAEWLKRRGC